MKKKRTILSPKLALKLKNKIEIFRIEEYPTYEREECEVEKI